MLVQEGARLDLVFEVVVSGSVAVGGAVGGVGEGEAALAFRAIVGGGGDEAGGDATAVAMVG